MGVSAPLISALAFLAVAAALARDANGIAYWPAWAMALAQAPLVIVWAISKAGGRTATPGSGPSIDRALTGVVAVGAAMLAFWRRSPDVFFTATTVFIAAQLLLGWLAHVYHRIDERVLEPAGLLVLVIRSWTCVALAGTVLLSLPLATHSWVPDYRHNFWLHIVNSAHAAVSSACLVGVGAYDLGGNYTRFGQFVIVVLTQLSGMAFAALGLAAVQPFLSRVIRLRTVMLTSVVIQVVAILIMAPFWSAGDVTGGAQRIWWGVVHAGSALWNSGWMLRSDGLAAYLSDSMIFSTMALLAIAGSLSIPVLLDLIRGPAGGRALPQPAWQRLVSWEAGGALVMLVLGAVLLFYFETPRVVPERLVPSRPVDFGEGRVSIRDDIGPRARWSMSAFQSATLRSAGLQSFPLSQGAISWPSYGMLLLWMMIGGSLGGVAGGMRLSVLLLLALTLLVNRTAWATPGGPAVRDALLRRCARWLTLWLLLNATVVLVLASVTDGSWYESVFEAVAAFNSVGLSTGLSLHLTWGGRLAMIAMMVLGRLLPVAFWLGLSREVTAALRTPTSRPAEAV
ncbi:MAG TPA: potassium transporter TrkG [Phycisphaerae bacterium]|nr:potassium transporter TrkG [Phycisphaerae bacterium]